MERTNFYKPEEVKSLYSRIVPAYQKAFAGEPWFEVSKCEDSSGQMRCVGGFSSLTVGSVCKKCGNCFARPAYEDQELVNKFKLLDETRPTAWYLEASNVGTTLAAIAWVAEPARVAKERYPDNPDMEFWMTDELGRNSIGWLDEVFANKTLKPSGNLKNFYAMCVGFARILGVNTLAYRTINEHMTAATIRDFRTKALIYKRNVMVPDRRDFVIIDIGGK